MKKASLFEIFRIFFIIGMQLLGGGYVIVPLLKKYIVDERQWLNDEELTDYFAMSQCLPGIIAGNISIFCGYKAGGFKGAVCAISGIIAPCFICIIILAKLLSSVIDYPIVQHAFWGVKISVIILILVTIKDLWKSSVYSIFTYILFGIILILLLVCSVSPAVIIICSAITALAYNYLRKGKANV